MDHPNQSTYILKKNLLFRKPEREIPASYTGETNRAALCNGFEEIKALTVGETPEPCGGFQMRAARRTT